MLMTIVQDAATGAAASPAAADTPLGLGALLVLFVGGSLAVLAWASRVRPMNLALGFATTVAMWTFAYVALLQPGRFAGEALFAGSVACVLAGGFVAGRFAPGESSGLRVGLVSATVNLLVIGAFLRDEQGGGGMQRPVLYVAGLFAASAILGAVGDRLGRAKPSARRLPAAPALLGAVAVANILVMIVLGGIVTGYEAGLAVPDWPNSFGHNMLLYPVSEMKGGIFYEHAHRLFGMLVGATVLAFTALAWSGYIGSKLLALMSPERSGPGAALRNAGRRVLVALAAIMSPTRTDAPTPKPAAARWLAILLLALVITQGVLGGLRVTGKLTASLDPRELSPSTALAIVHGMLGQVVFGVALLATFAASGAWDAVRGRAQGASIRALPAIALAALAMQLFLGASMRHLQSTPTADTGAKIPAWALHGHVTMALIAFIVVFLAGMRCSKVADVAPVRALGKALMHSVGLQLLLGVGALVAVLLRRGEAVPWWEAASTTAHQALGAVLIACALALAVMARRATDAGAAPAAVR
jgi:cytochrome c oxidase assembly protein subunit 15